MPDVLLNCSPTYFETVSLSEPKPHHLNEKRSQDPLHKYTQLHAAFYVVV